MQCLQPRTGSTNILVAGLYLHVARPYSIIKKNCNYKVLYECDWIINEDTVVRPDVLVTCEPIEGNYPTKPPSLILEILSPQNLLKDRNTKFNLYKSYGVRYYLIADIDRHEIECFQLIDNRYKQMDGINEFMLTNNCSFNVELNILFND
ncbi:MAG: Uma2 family endonuclease [Bacteroidetes bacterium]|nr:Uma2 family endonuclease [Bacteroidota bacterium]